MLSSASYCQQQFLNRTLRTVTPYRNKLHECLSLFDSSLAKRICVFVQSHWSSLDIKVPSFYDLHSQNLNSYFRNKNYVLACNSPLRGDMKMCLFLNNVDFSSSLSLSYLWGAVGSTVRWLNASIWAFKLDLVLVSGLTTALHMWPWTGYLTSVVFSFSSVKWVH